MAKNKSQVSIYVIIGLVVIMIMGGILYFSMKENIADNYIISDEEFSLHSSINDFIDNCVHETFYLAEERYGIDRYRSSANLEQYMINYLPSCFNKFEIYKEKGFGVSYEDMVVDVTINADTIFVDLDFPLRIWNDELSYTFEKTQYDFPRIIMTKLEIYNDTILVTPDRTLKLEIPQGTVVTLDGEEIDEVGIRLLDRHFDGLENSVVAGMLAVEGVPHGAKFSKPFTLTKYYTDSDVPFGIREEEMNLGYYDWDKGVWVGLPTYVDSVNNILKVESNHFSPYTAVLGCDEKKTGKQVYDTPILINHVYEDCEDSGWIPVDNAAHVLAIDGVENIDDLIFIDIDTEGTISQGEGLGILPADYGKSEYIKLAICNNADMTEEQCNSCIVEIGKKENKKPTGTCGCVKNCGECTECTSMGPPPVPTGCEEYCLEPEYDYTPYPIYYYNKKGVGDGTFQGYGEFTLELESSGKTCVFNEYDQFNAELVNTNEDSSSDEYGSQDITFSDRSGDYKDLKLKIYAKISDFKGGEGTSTCKDQSDGDPTGDNCLITNIGRDGTGGQAIEIESVDGVPSVHFYLKETNKYENIPDACMLGTATIELEGIGLKESKLTSEDCTGKDLDPLPGPTYIKGECRVCQKDVNSGEYSWAVAKEDVCTKDFETLCSSKKGPVRQWTGTVCKVCEFEDGGYVTNTYEGEEGKAYCKTCIDSSGKKDATSSLGPSIIANVLKITGFAGDDDPIEVPKHIENCICVNDQQKQIVPPPLGTSSSGSSSSSSSSSSSGGGGGENCYLNSVTHGNCDGVEGTLSASEVKGIEVNNVDCDHRTANICDIGESVKGGPYVVDGLSKGDGRCFVKLVEKSGAGSGDFVGFVKYDCIKDQLKPNEEECSESKPCDDGFVCVDNECVEEECNDETPCEEGYLCVDNLCESKDNSDVLYLGFSEVPKNNFDEIKEAGAKVGGYEFTSIGVLEDLNNRELKYYVQLDESKYVSSGDETLNMDDYYFEDIDNLGYEVVGDVCNSGLDHLKLKSLYDKVHDKDEYLSVIMNFKTPECILDSLGGMYDTCKTECSATDNLYYNSDICYHDDKCTTPCVDTPVTCEKIENVYVEVIDVGFLDVTAMQGDLVVFMNKNSVNMTFKTTYFERVVEPEQNFTYQFTTAESVEVTDETDTKLGNVVITPNAGYTECYKICSQDLYVSDEVCYTKDDCTAFCEGTVDTCTEAVASQVDYVDVIMFEVTNETNVTEVCLSLVDIEQRFVPKIIIYEDTNTTELGEMVDELKECGFGEFILSPWEEMKDRVDDFEDVLLDIFSQEEE